MKTHELITELRQKFEKLNLMANAGTQEPEFVGQDSTPTNQDQLLAEKFAAFEQSITAFKNLYLRHGTIQHYLADYEYHKQILSRKIYTILHLIIFAKNQKDTDTKEQKDEKNIAINKAKDMIQKGLEKLTLYHNIMQNDLSFIKDLIALIEKQGAEFAKNIKNLPPHQQILIRQYQCLRSWNANPQTIQNDIILQTRKKLVNQGIVNNKKLRHKARLDELKQKIDSIDQEINDQQNTLGPKQLEHLKLERESLKRRRFSVFTKYQPLKNTPELTKDNIEQLNQFNEYFKLSSPVIARWQLDEYISDLPELIKLLQKLLPYCESEFTLDLNLSLTKALIKIDDDLHTLADSHNNTAQDYATYFQPKTIQNWIDEIENDFSSNDIKILTDCVLLTGERKADSNALTEKLQDCTEKLFQLQSILQTKTNIAEMQLKNKPGTEQFKFILLALKLMNTHIQIVENETEIVVAGNALLNEAFHAARSELQKRRTKSQAAALGNKENLPQNAKSDSEISDKSANETVANHAFAL